MARPTLRYLICLALLAPASALARDHSGLALSREEPAPVSTPQGKQPKTHLVSFRSCSQNPNKLCNKRFFEQLAALSLDAKKIPNIELHHLFQGLPPEIMADRRWALHLREGLKGRGYWFWKAAILNLLIKNGTLQDGDRVIWADGDVRGYFEGERGWRAWLRESRLDFFVQGSRFCEAQWTKGDIWRRFKLEWWDGRYGLTPQAWAQFFIFRVNERTRQLLRMWEDLMTDFHLVSDGRSESPNPPLFKQNRHDQSMLSLLVKGNIPFKPPFMGDCTWYAERNNHTVHEDYDKSLHPEFGIANLSAQIGDFAQERYKATQLSASSDGESLQRRETAGGSAQRRLCVQGSCYDLDELKGAHPKEVSELEEASQLEA